MRQPSELIVHGRPDEPIGDIGRGNLWILDLDEADLSSPSPRDIVLSEAFRRRIDRQRSLARSVLVGQVLGNALGAPPGSLEFEKSECGKPRVKQVRGVRPIDFSLSHSENVLGLVLISGREAGIDVELVDTGIDFSALETTLFEPQELDELSQSSDPVRAFYSAWTRKEAVAKMNGHGVFSRHMKGAQGTDPSSLHTFEFESSRGIFVGSVAFSSPGMSPR